MAVSLVKGPRPARAGVVLDKRYGRAEVGTVDSEETHEIAGGATYYLTGGTGTTCGKTATVLMTAQAGTVINVTCGDCRKDM